MGSRSITASQAAFLVVGFALVVAGVLIIAGIGKMRGDAGRSSAIASLPPHYGAGAPLQAVTSDFKR